MNRFFRTMLALLMVALLPGLAVAQGPISVEAKEGFDGYYKPGAWVPVFVNVSNQPTRGQALGDLVDFEGQLMMTTLPVDGNTPLRFMRSIDVPRASSKRYNLYIKLPDRIPPGQTVPLLLNASNGKFIESFPLKFARVPTGSVLLVHVSDALSRPAFPRIRERMDAIIQTGISPMMLPDYWAAYDSVDIVAFSGWPDRGMTEEARQALSDWVHGGGTLVFLGGGETATYQDTASQEFLPVTIEGTGQLLEQGSSFRFIAADEEKPERANAYVASVASPKEGAEVLLAAGEAPIIVRQRMGNGQVVFFANDLKSQSVQLERFLAPAWLAVVPVTNIAEVDVDIPATIQSFRSVTGRAARPPNQFLIILICIAYTLTVGPLNFGLLSRKKKLEWAWFTVPVIVLVFFFLIYGMGRLTKGDSKIVRELTLERFHEGSTEGSSMTIYNTFVSSPRTHFLTPMAPRHALGDPFRWQEHDPYRQQQFFGGIFNPATAGGMGASGSAPLLAYDTRDGEFGKMENIQVRAWSMATYDASSFLSHGPTELKGQLDANLVWGPGGPVGTIRNETEHDFEEAWLVAGSDALRIGPMKKGEEFTLRPTDTLRAYTASAAGEARGSRWLPLNALLDAGSDKTSEEDAAISRSNASLLLKTLYSPERTATFLPPRRGQIAFLGYRNEDMSEVMTSINADTKSRAVISTIELKATPPKGSSFRITNEYLQHRMHDYDSAQNGTFSLNQSGHLELFNAHGVFSVELPFSHPDLEITGITLFPSTFTRQGQTLTFSLYRHGANAGWVEINPEQPIDNSGFALPVNGRLYYRIESKETNPAGGGGSMFDGNHTRIENLRVTMDGRVR